MLGEALAIGVFGILLVEKSAILEDQLGHVTRRRGGIDPTLESIAHQSREIARMVEVGMGEHHGIDAGRRH